MICDILTTVKIFGNGWRMSHVSLRQTVLGVDLGDSGHFWSTVFCRTGGEKGYLLRIGGAARKLLSAAKY